MLKKLGGGIFNEDNSDYYQCFFDMNSLYSKGEVLATLPDCFLKFENFPLQRFISTKFSPSMIQQVEMDNFCKEA